MFQFEENERKRMKSEQNRQENKHKKQWDELLFRNESSLRELEQLQVRNYGAVWSWSSMFAQTRKLSHGTRERILVLGG